MFQPNLGRWMQEDPIGFEGEDMNLYGYEGENPMNFLDPSGLQPGGIGRVPRFNPKVKPGELPVEEEGLPGSPYFRPLPRTGDPLLDDPEIGPILRRIRDLVEELTTPGPNWPKPFPVPELDPSIFWPADPCLLPAGKGRPVVIEEQPPPKIDIRVPVPMPAPRAKPRPTPEGRRGPILNDPDEEEELERICGEQYDADCEICRKLKDSGARKRCWASAMERKVACKFKRPIPDLITK